MPTVTLDANESTGTLIVPVDSGDPTGPYEWGDHVTIQSYGMAPASAQPDTPGTPVATVQDTPFTDPSIGPDGGRWPTQIDYTDGVLDFGGVPHTDASDLILSVPIWDVTLTVAQMDPSEGPSSAHECGQWFAYDEADQLCGIGWLHQSYSELGWGVKESGSAGSIPFKIVAPVPIKRIRLQGAAWSTEYQVAQPDNNSSNGALSSNNTDFAIGRLTYTYGETYTQPGFDDPFDGAALDARWVVSSGTMGVSGGALHPTTIGTTCALQNRTKYGSRYRAHIEVGAIAGQSNWLIAVQVGGTSDAFSGTTEHAQSRHIEFGIKAAELYVEEKRAGTAWTKTQTKSFTPPSTPFTMTAEVEDGVVRFYVNDIEQWTYTPSFPTFPVGQEVGLRLHRHNSGTSINSFTVEPLEEYAPPSLTRVTATRNTIWNVQNRIVASRATGWGVRQRVAVARATVWNARQRIAATRTTTWGQMQRVLAARSTVWPVRQRISTVRSSTWAARQRVISTRVSTWAVRSRLFVTRSTLWPVLQRVSRTVTTTWGIDSTLERVTALRSTSWAVGNRIVSERATSWAVRNRIVSSRSTGWAVRSRLVAQRSTSWSVLQRLVASKSTAWSALQRVTVTRTTSWGQIGRVVSSVETFWSVLKRIVVERTTTWRVSDQIETIDYIFLGFEEHQRVVTFDEEARLIQYMGDAMQIHVQGVDYYDPRPKTTPVVAPSEWRLSVDDGQNWIAPVVINGFPKWLVAGPEANNPDPNAINLTGVSTIPLIMARNDPEQTIQYGPEILTYK